MAKSSAHTFHTRHDFTPELGWAAFQLVAELNHEGVSASDLQRAARTATSPLARRADLTKVLASLEDLGLLAQNGKSIALSGLGRALAGGLGAFEMGFRASVHCIYAWQWLLEQDKNHASPSWSYREVCRQLLASPPTGIAADDLVLGVVDAASIFAVEKVSFSRSSVSGVINWLWAQAPQLVEHVGRKITRVRGQAPSATLLRVNLAAACALEGGRFSLDGSTMALVAESLLVPQEELWLPMVEFVRDSAEFAFIPGGRGTVAFDQTEDQFISWLSVARGGRQ